MHYIISQISCPHYIDCTIIISALVASVQLDAPLIDKGGQNDRIVRDSVYKNLTISFLFHVELFFYVENLLTNTIISRFINIRIRNRVLCQYCVSTVYRRRDYSPSLEILRKYISLWHNNYNDNTINRAKLWQIFAHYDKIYEDEKSHI